MRRIAFLLFGIAAGCGSDRGPSPQRGKPTAEARPSTAPSSPVPVVSVTAAPREDASSAAATAAPETPFRASDCKVARGPVRLARRGDFVFHLEASVAKIGWNDKGAPTWEQPVFPAATAKPASAPLLRPPGAAATATATAESTAPPVSTERAGAICAVAGGSVFCADSEGQIKKRSLAGGEDKVFARGRKGTPVWAAVAGEHTFVAFLANQKTSEGAIVRAFVAIDDELPVPLSEDGSGATSVALLGREADALAMYIDARTALTPVHARVLFPDKRPVLGPDAVVFVGPGAETHVEAAIGRGESGPAYLFIPGPTEDGGFGLATVAVHGMPKDDLPARTLKYPDAMTRPLAAATTGVSPVRVAYTRPKAKGDATVVLELGTVDSNGAVTARCAIAESNGFDHVALATAENGRFWVAYATPDGTFVEERGENEALARRGEVDDATRMGAAAQKIQMTPEDYLAFERASDVRHEYVDGEIFAMSGGTIDHATVAGNLIGELRNALAGRRCRVLTSDMRIHIPATKSFVYPDAAVLCGPAEFYDDRRDTLMNPSAIVEVLSDSTEAYDRGDKFGGYRTVESISTYVLASQRQPRLEVFTRRDDGSWSLRSYGLGERAALPALDIFLEVDGAYAEVFGEAL